MQKLIALAGVAAVASVAAAGDWAQWSGNGHWYKLVEAPNGITWAGAEAGAEALGGTLATLTSSGENQFAFTLVDVPEVWIVDQFGSNIGPWIGLLQAPGAPEPGGGWQWVTGEAFSYSAWSPGEPNNYNGVQENRGHFFGAGGAGRRAYWNDIPEDDAALRGYLVESTIPTPGVVGVVGAACVAVGRRQRR